MKQKKISRIKTAHSAPKARTRKKINPPPPAIHEMLLAKKSVTALITKGKRSGTLDEMVISTVIESEKMNPYAIDALIELINNASIRITTSTSTDSSLNSNDEHHIKKEIEKQSRKSGKRIKKIKKTSASKAMHDIDPITLYLREISKIPLLSFEQELELGRTIKQGKAKLNTIAKKYSVSITTLLSGKIPASKFKSTAARQQLIQRVTHISDTVETAKKEFIKANLRLVVKLAKSYIHTGVPFLDIIDEGNIGLMEAVDHYDYLRGVRFCTYAIWWIRQHINRSFSRHIKIIKVPFYIEQIAKKFLAIQKQFTKMYGYEPSLHDLSKNMKLSVNRIIEIIRLSQEPSSLESQIEADGYTELGDLIEDTKNMSPIETVYTIQLRETIENAINQLRFKEQVVIRMRFGLTEHGPCSLEKISRYLGLTRERVRQIQQIALKKMYLLARESAIKDFIINN